MKRLTGGRRIVAVTAVGTGLALAAAACGSPHSNSLPANPQSAVQQSIANLTSSSSLGVTVSLGLTSAQVKQLSTLGGGSAPTDQEAQALSSGSIFLKVSTGHGEALDSQQTTTDSANNFDIGLTTDGNTPVEFRVVDQNLYLRFQLHQLQSDTGTAQTNLSKINSEVTKLNSDIPGISALVAGNWVEISHASLQPLLSMLKSLEASQGAPSNSSIMQDVTKLRQSFDSALNSNSSTVKVGTSGSRTEYNVTVHLKPFLQQFGTALQNELNSLPAGAGTKYSSTLTNLGAKVPASQTLVMQVYVQNNKAQEIDVDLNQFAPSGQKAPFAVPLKIVFSSNVSISAPSGSTPLDLSKLPQLLQGMAGSLGGSSSSSSSG